MDPRGVTRRDPATLERAIYTGSMSSTNEPFRASRRTFTLNLAIFAVAVLAIIFVALALERRDSAAQSGPSAPSVQAWSGILVDGVTGHVLWEKSPDRRLGPASLTKIMTAIPRAPAHQGLQLLLPGAEGRGHGQAWQCRWPPCRRSHHGFKQTRAFEEFIHLRTLFFRRPLRVPIRHLQNRRMPRRDSPACYKKRDSPPIILLPRSRYGSRRSRWRAGSDSEFGSLPARLRSAFDP